MKKLSAIAMSLGLILCTTAAASAEVTKLKIVSAPFGRHLYTMGAACEDLAKKYVPDLDISVEEGFGMVYNMKKMDSLSKEERASTITLASDVSLWQAASGLPPYPRKMKVDDFRVLCSIMGSVSFFMSLDPSIKSVGDFAGKTVAIGNKSQDLYGEFLWNQINLGYGLGDKVRVQWVGNAAAVSNLKDGLADVCPAGVVNNPVTNALIGEPSTMEIETSFDNVSWIGSSKEALMKTAAANNSPIKIYTIPAGSFKGQTEDVYTHGSLQHWAASTEMPEEVAYKFVKMIIDHVDKFKDYHAAGGLITREVLVFGVTPENVHPGAYRAFKEAGLMK